MTSRIETWILLRRLALKLEHPWSAAVRSQAVVVLAEMTLDERIRLRGLGYRA